MTQAYSLSSPEKVSSVGLSDVEEKEEKEEERGAEDEAGGEAVDVMMERRETGGWEVIAMTLASAFAAL